MGWHPTQDGKWVGKKTHLPRHICPGVFASTQLHSCSTDQLPMKFAQVPMYQMVDKKVGWHPTQEDSEVSGYVKGEV